MLETPRLSDYGPLPDHFAHLVRTSSLVLLLEVSISETFEDVLFLI
jgi:hypothetical protein